jgi:2-polyprenyl-6-methoxyphenol hydroxylase-like FAD-dependent oxidoreductase
MPTTLNTSCCIAGGGPAGMMLGFLLARMGVRVIVLEKHADFLRDFRGDTIHPSTLELMYELGLLEEFLKRPHQKVTELSAVIGGETVKLADFTHLPTHCKMLALMPQWDFLNFLVEQGRRYQTFAVRMQSEVTGLIEEEGRIAGFQVKTPDGPLEIRASLNVGADGRSSIVRQSAGLEVIDLGAPMDVLWLRISKKDGDPEQTLGYVQPGRLFIMIARDEYWQCGYIIAKGEFDEIRKQGIERFRDEIVKLAPFVGDRVTELRDWNDVSLLTVKVDRLQRWSRPGLLCIGDAAHAMSPIGGVGINLAIQDAVATANILGPKLSTETLAAGNLVDHDLEAVQHRRQFLTYATQKLQVLIQNRVIRRLLAGEGLVEVPWPMKLAKQWPFLRRIPARMVGVGFRPEHIQTPDILSQAAAASPSSQQKKVS